MVRLDAPSGWGTVRDPETDERVPVDDDFDGETADRLADEYAPLSVEGGEAEDEDEGDEEEAGFDPSEYTLDELEAELEDADIDADADTLHERESEGKGREGAHEIIDAVVED